MKEDIIHTLWVFAFLFTAYKISHKPKDDELENVWRVVHRTCKVEDFKDELDKAKKDILGVFYEGEIPDLVSIVNAQEIIRSRVGRVVVFSTKDLNNCYNILSNSDWNCVQDRTTFALVTDLKSYTGPCEVSFDIELRL